MIDELISKENIMLEIELERFSIEDLQKEITRRKDKYPKIVSQVQFCNSRSNLHTSLSSLIKAYYKDNDKNMNDLKLNIADKVLDVLFNKVDLDKLYKL